MSAMGQSAIPLPEPFPPIPEGKKEGILIGVVYGGYAGWKLGNTIPIPGVAVFCAVAGGAAGAIAGGSLGGWMEES